MMRIAAIAGGLLAGLLGLFMSVCGGGLVISTVYGTLRDLLGAHRVPGGMNVPFSLLLPVGFLALGIFVCRSAYRSLRKHLNDK